MIKLFNLVLMTKKELTKERLNVAQVMDTIYQNQQNKTLHCGYKSCQFHTTDPKGLKIHRSRVHRKK